MHSLLILLFSLFQQGESVVTYSMPIDKNGRLVTMELLSDSTFRFTVRTYEMNDETDWYTHYTTVKGNYIRNGNRIEFSSREKEVQKFRHLTGSARNGYDWKKLNDSQKCTAKKNAGGETIALKFEGEAFFLSRSLKSDSAMIRAAGHYTTDMAADSDTHKEIRSVYNLYLAPCTFFARFGYGHYFNLEYAYTDFEGGSTLHHIEGTYAVIKGKIHLYTVVYAEQNDAPLSGMTWKTLTFKNDDIEIECADDGCGQIRLKHPSYSGFIFRRKE